MNYKNLLLKLIITMLCALNLGFGGGGKKCGLDENEQTQQASSEENIKKVKCAKLTQADCDISSECVFINPACMSLESFWKNDTMVATYLNELDISTAEKSNKNKILLDIALFNKNLSADKLLLIANKLSQIDTTKAFQKDKNHWDARKKDSDFIVKILAQLQQPSLNKQTLKDLLKDKEIKKFPALEKIVQQEHDSLDAAGQGVETEEVKELKSLLSDSHKIVFGQEYKDVWNTKQQEILQKLSESEAEVWDKLSSDDLNTVNHLLLKYYSSDVYDNSGSANRDPKLLNELDQKGLTKYISKEVFSKYREKLFKKGQEENNFEIFKQLILQNKILSGSKDTVWSEKSLEKLLTAEVMQGFAHYVVFVSGDNNVLNRNENDFIYSPKHNNNKLVKSFKGFLFSSALNFLEEPLKSNNNHLFRLRVEQFITEYFQKAFPILKNADQTWEFVTADKLDPNNPDHERALKIWNAYQASGA